MKSIFCSIFLVFILASLCINCGGIRTSSKKPTNIIVILCDDLGYGDLSSYGHPQIRTPHLDEFAKEGLRLTTCYSASPVCSPSRAGLLTGRIPDRTGVYNWIPSDHVMYLPEGETTIARVLQSAGYQTAQFGKWHLNGQFNQDSQPQPDDHGFDYWFATQNNAAPSHENPVNFVRNGEEVGPLNGFSCEIVINEAINWLNNSRNNTSPLFMYIAFHEPHEPVASPQALVETYTEAKNEDEAQYFANVTNMDAAVGKLFSALKELNLYNESLIIFSSDNGPETLDRYPNATRSYGSPGNLRGMKLHMYEGGIRVPGIMRWPIKIPSGTISDEAVSSIDFFPTICQVAGLQIPDSLSLDGTSLFPLFNAETLTRSQPLFWRYFRALGEPTIATRKGSLKLLGITNIEEVKGSPLDSASMHALKNDSITAVEAYYLKSDIVEKNESFDLTDTEHVQFYQQMDSLFQAIQTEGPIWEFPADTDPNL